MYVCVCVCVCVCVVCVCVCLSTRSFSLTNFCDYKLIFKKYKLKQYKFRKYKTETFSYLIFARHKVTIVRQHVIRPENSVLLNAIIR